LKREHYLNTQDFMDKLGEELKKKISKA